MGAPMDMDFNFKSQFYNLEGIHINERKKNFYKLLKSTRPDLPDDQIDIQPRNYQENIFYVDVLIHFKKVEKLTDILKGGIGVLTSKILKQKWYFQENFKNMSEDDIVKKLLPSLTKSLRMKVLKKLSLTLSEERMDKIFDLVLDRYGLFIAKQFLFSCSSEKIVHVLKTNEIIVSVEQLKRFLQKDINLLKVYFEEYKKNTRKDFDDRAFLNYLVWKHPHLYFELGLNNNGFIKLGRFTTRAVIKTNKDDVLKDVKNRTWNKAALTREIKEFNKEYLCLFFPDDMTLITNYDYESNLVSLVSKYPIKKRWEVLSQAFKHAYKNDIDEHLDKFQENFAKFFPEKVQQKWAEIQYMYTDNFMYFKYYDPKKAFQLLKDKINLTSVINLRCSLLNELITVCYTSKDYSTYAEVLRYMCMRHRNDDRHVRWNMIFHIKYNIDYNLLSEIHWKYITEIIDMQRVRGERLSMDLITQYLLFLYRKNLPLDGPVTQYVQDYNKDNTSCRYLEHLEQPEAESTILKRIAKVFEHENSKENTYKIMSSIVDFNQEIKNDKVKNKEFKKNCIDLNECPLIMNLIKDVCTKQKPYDTTDYNVIKYIVLYNCLYSEIPLKGIDENDLLNTVEAMACNTIGDDVVNLNCAILQVIKKPKRNYFESTLLDNFFCNSNENVAFLKELAIQHFLAAEPGVIAKYFDAILSLKSSGAILDYGMIKKYSHLGLDEKVINHFKNLISVESKCDNKTELISVLSKVMNTKDFLDLVKDYIPQENKLDLNNEVQRELYQVQCDLAKAFKNLDEVLLLAPVLMHFCQGDYLQSSLSALYRVLYRINEEQVFSYINVLGLRAMSTRKHAVFLGLELLSLKDAMTIYSDLSNRESNISSKKYLFDAVLKYFLKNPLNSVLDIVFLNMSFVNKNDSKMIQTLVDSVSKVPNKYKPVFIEKVWNFLDVLEAQEVKVTSFRNILLHLINGYETSLILRLNKSFCENTIKKYFFSSDDNLQKTSKDIDGFVINYLLAYLDETSFIFIFSIIKTYKDHWESNNEDNGKYIFRFFSDAYEKFDENDVQFYKLFTHSWQHLFSHVESFVQYTLLGLMGLYKDNPSIEAFCKEVDKFLQELTVQYGSYIGELLIRSIRQFFSNIPTKCNTDFNLGSFAICLLQSSSSEFNCFVAFNIIENFASTDQKVYSKVVATLQEVTNLTVKIYCNVLLKKN